MTSAAQRVHAAVDIGIAAVGGARVDMCRDRVGARLGRVIIDIEDARRSGELQLAAGTLGDVEARFADSAALACCPTRLLLWTMRGGVESGFGGGAAG